MVHNRTIETSRLVLRPHCESDFAAMCALWCDPDVTRYMGGRPLAAEEVWARLLRYAGTWSLFGYGFWIIHEKTTGNFVGEVGFLNVRRDIVPSFGDRIEFGYALQLHAQGKGYAREAARAAVEWGDNVLPECTMLCMIEPANLASIRLASTLGFIETVRSEYKGSIVILLVRDGALPRR